MESYTSSLVCDIIGAWRSNQEETHQGVSQPLKLVNDSVLDEPQLSYHGFHLDNPINDYVNPPTSTSDYLPT